MQHNAHRRGEREDDITEPRKELRRVRGVVVRRPLRNPSHVNNAFGPDLIRWRSGRRCGLRATLAAQIRYTRRMRGGTVLDMDFGFDRFPEGAAATAGRQ